MSETVMPENERDEWAETILRLVAELNRWEEYAAMKRILDTLIDEDPEEDQLKDDVMAGFGLVSTHEMLAEGHARGAVESGDREHNP